MNDTQTLQAFESVSVRRQSQANLPLRILVAEDDPYIRHLNSEALIRHGYEVNAAEDGAAAWEALNADGYDLLITDNDMPKVSGVELLKKLRAARLALPVILATGSLPWEEFARHPWLQPDATLLKPYTIAEFLGTVKEVLRATDGARGPIDPPPNWQSWPAADRWQQG